MAKEPKTKLEKLERDLAEAHEHIEELIQEKAELTRKCGDLETELDLLRMTVECSGVDY